MKRDMDMFNLIEQEHQRQKRGIELIASENFVSKQVMEAMGSCLTNKYAEGYPGKRYYGGCEVIDKVEQEAIDRLCRLYDAEYANVQPHSGAQANMAVFLTVLEPGDTFMGLDLSHGGHLSHGSPVNSSGILYRAVSYGLDQETGLIDYDAMEKVALEEKPKLIIGGAMANTFLKARGIDTKRSMVEEDLVDTAADIMRTAEENSIELLLPVDLVAADRFSKDAQTVKVPVEEIPDNWMGLDIGPETAERFAKALENAGTIVWNGPMGVFEMSAFMEGTKSVAEAVARSGAFSIVGGGDTGLAVKMCGVSDGISYISTGGGAFLHLMEGRELPGVTALT